MINHKFNRYYYSKKKKNIYENFKLSFRAGDYEISLPFSSRNT